MAQSKTTASQPNLTALSELIQVIAANPTSTASVAAILQQLMDVTGASGAAFVVFDEPNIVISAGETEDWAGKGDTLKSISQSLPNGIHTDFTLPAGFRAQYAGKALAPLRSQQAVGAAWLSYRKDYKPTKGEQDTALPLIHALTIIAGNLQAQEQAERARQLTLSLLGSITDPLLVLDDSHNVMLMNPAAEAVFKTTSEGARGKGIGEVVASDELAAVAAGNNTLQEWITPDDKTYIPKLEAVHDEAGNIEGWVLALRDVTHFKKLNRNQNEFMRIVSHDLRSPLTSMQGFASMLELGLVGELNEKQKHFVSKILAGITQMTALVDNIQDAGRYDPETGFYDLSRSQVDLGEMVQRIVENHLVPAEKALSISVAVADNVPIINADANMLERAIINLFDNAIKYTPDGGKIEIGVQRSTEDVVVLVRDTGLGISKDAQSHLFERHVRIAREEHKKIKGSGLGLFIVRSVAQRHGGDAWVESKEGEGSTFFLGIPLEGPNLVVSGKN